jgi:hypothetical protein
MFWRKSSRFITDSTRLLVGESQSRGHSGTIPSKGAGVAACPCRSVAARRSRPVAFRPGLSATSVDRSLATSRDHVSSPGRAWPSSFRGGLPVDPRIPMVPDVPNWHRRAATGDSSTSALLQYKGWARRPLREAASARRGVGAVLRRLGAVEGECRSARRARRLTGSGAAADGRAEVGLSAGAGAPGRHPFTLGFRDGSARSAARWAHGRRQASLGTCYSSGIPALRRPA